MQCIIVIMFHAVAFLISSEFLRSAACLQYFIFSVQRKRAKKSGQKSPEADRNLFDVIGCGVRQSTVAVGSENAQDKQ